MDIINNEALGEKIRFYRRKRKMTQDELGQKAQLEPTWLSHVETANKNAGLDTIIQICHALLVTPNDLLADSLPDAQATAEANSDEEAMYQQIREMLKQSLPDEAEILFQTFKTLFQELKKKRELNERQHSAK